MENNEDTEVLNPELVFDSDEFEYCSVEEFNERKKQKGY